MAKVRLIKHEAIPDCGSFKLASLAFTRGRLTFQTFGLIILIVAVLRVEVSVVWEAASATTLRGLPC